MSYTVILNSLPGNLDELKALPEAGLKTPEGTAALTIAALAVFPKDAQECYRMLDFLRGPRPLSAMERTFISDRFMGGKDYLARSYFKGAVPENDYTPDTPFVLEFADSNAQMAEEGYKILMVRSGGADSPRSITLRNKPSTGEWFLWDQMLLAGIRIPTSRDAWA